MGKPVSHILASTDVLVSSAARMITQDHKLSGSNTMHVLIMLSSGGQECGLGPPRLRSRCRHAALLSGSSRERFLTPSVLKDLILLAVVRAPFSCWLAVT